MLLKSPSIIKLINDLIHQFIPFNWIFETDEERENFVLTIDDVSKLCKIRSDDSVWIVKNFTDKGLTWHPLSGLNSYELDKKYNGFTGTLDEWFEHWRGFSAFEIWQQITNKPTAPETEFFDYLKGESGNDASIYTFSEKRLTKIWTNKKQIWRKVINLGLLSNNSYTDVLHDIFDLEHITSLYGFAINNDGSTYTIPTAISNFQVSLVLNNDNPTKIRIQTTGDWTSYTGLAIIEYTKKSDKVLADSEIDALIISRGETGKSSFDLAKEYGGFTGTEVEWYDMIVNRNDKNILIYGASDPTEFIPIINYTNANPNLHISNQNIFTHNNSTWIREGKNLYVRGTFSTTVAGTGNRTDIFLPENLTIDNMSENPSFEGVVGNCFILNTNDPSQYFISAKKNTKYVTLKNQQQDKNNNNFNITANKTYTYWFKVPIKEWSASKILPLNSLEDTIGDSAFDIAVKKGFIGNEQEWLDSFTAFNIAKKNGYTGTEEEWTTALIDKNVQNILAYSAGKELEFIPKIEGALYTENKATYVREGKNIYIRGLITFSSACTSELRIYLPENITLNCLQASSSKIINHLGTLAFWNADPLNIIYHLTGEHNKNYVRIFIPQYNEIVGNGALLNASWAGQTVCYEYKASINEWQGSEFAEEIWNGTVGDSAYEIAVKNGFVGTEEEWLQTLSSFNIAQKHGFTGTEEEFYLSLSEIKDKQVFSFTAGTEQIYEPIWINVSTIESKATYIREGKNLYCRGYVKFATNSVGYPFISLPPGLTIDDFNLNVDYFEVGYLNKLKSNDSNFDLIFMATKNQNTLSIHNKLTGINAGKTWNVAGTSLSYWFKVPIKEWTGSFLSDEIFDSTVGNSAYEIAIKNGYTGTEKQWLDSLTSYGIAIKNGYSGTEEEWIELLSKNTEKQVFAYSSSEIKKYENPEWENILIIESKINYVREGKFMVVQGSCLVSKQTINGKIKLFLPLKDEIFISGLDKIESVNNLDSLVVGDSILHTQSSNVKVMSNNTWNYVYFYDMIKDSYIGTNLVIQDPTTFEFNFRVPIYQWKGSTVLEEIWDGTLGDSSYDLACKNGFIGTVDDYLYSLNSIGTAKSTGLLDKDATEEDWYKLISTYGLAVKYDNYLGTINDWLADQRTSRFPENGTTGQLLTKQSEIKDDVKWQDITYDVKTYIHEQLEKSLKWVINHNLNTTDYDYIIKDENLEIVLCDINLEESSLNTLVVEFRTAMHGKCFIYAKSSASIPIQTRTIVVESYAEKVKYLGEVSDALNIYISEAHVQQLILKGNINLKLMNWVAEGYSTSVILHIKSLGNFSINLLDKVKWSKGMKPNFVFNSESDLRVTFLSDDNGKNIYGFLNGYDFI